MAASLSATSLSMISQRPKSPIRDFEDKNCCFWTRPSCYLKQRNIIRNVSGGTSRKGTTLVSALLSTISRKSASTIPAFNEVCLSHLFFFLIYVGCPGQLTRTTTIPHGSLDILQAQEQVRHRGGDRRTHRGSNPGRERNKSHELTMTVKSSSAE